MSTDLDTLLARAAEAIVEADALLVTAGAGIGVDSGLPDFRGNEGFWRAYPPMAKLGIQFYDMANPFWFRRDPELAWGFYGHRFNLYRDTLPHAGFAILKRWTDATDVGSFVFTSNVDGQFQAAGFAADRIAECHGSISHLQCTVPCGRAIWPAGGLEIAVDPETFRAALPLPTCPGCGALARPNVLMFNDWHWVADRTAEQEERFESWLDAARNSKVVVIELGAGSAVPTVRMTSERIANRIGVTLVRINPREPQVPHGQIGLPLNALEALTAIEERLG